MKPTLKVFVGASLTGEEARFLRMLARDLSQVEAVILANFFAKGKQIDFVVVRPFLAAVLEHKNLTGPIWGDTNGPWEVQDQAGHRVRYPGDNPWRQTLDQKFALSDEMREYQRRHPGVPPAKGKSFAHDLGAFVTIVPSIHPDSEVTRGDRKVKVASYSEVLPSLLEEKQLSTWDLARWCDFAREQLNLQAASVEQATDRRVSSAGQLLESYCSRLVATVGKGLAPLLANGEELIEKLVGPTNVLLIGRSGAAKTFHLHHLATKLAGSMEEVPVLVEANRYRGGEFWTLLRYGTAPFLAEDPKALFEAVRLCGRRPAFLIDALNECPPNLLPDLLMGLQAAVVRFGGRVVYTSQYPVSLNGDLQAAAVECRLPNRQEKRLIYAHHAGLSPDASLDSYCAGFTNAYDLSIAGRCHGSETPPQSRTQLYDRYVRATIPAEFSISFSILRGLAAQLSRDCTVSCERDQFDRMAESQVAQNHASLRLLDDLKRSRLIRVSDDHVSFEHELLLDYFRAENLRRDVQPIAGLAQELQRPRHRDLFEFVLARHTDNSEIDYLLRVASTSEMVESVFRGVCGPQAADQLKLHCQMILDEAIRNLPQLSMEVFVADFGDRRVCGQVAIQGARNLTVYERLLHQLIAGALDLDCFQSKFLDLLDMTEWTLRHLSQGAAKEANVSSGSVWAQTVHAYGGMLRHGGDCPSCSLILCDIRDQSMRNFSESKHIPCRASLVERVRQKTHSSLALMALLQDSGAARDPEEFDLNLELAQRGWASRIGSLKLEALNFIQNMGRGIADNAERRKRACAVLESFETNDIMLNSLRLEILANWGGLDLPVTLEQAVAEMRGAIQPGAASSPEVIDLARQLEVSPFEFLANTACGALAKIFEDIFQGVYMEAYYALTPDERREILLLALQSQNQCWTAWSLRELRQHEDGRALAVYAQYAGGLDPKAWQPQEAVAAYVLALEGCARLTEVPPPYTAGDTPEHRAWRLFGEIVFWVSRAGVDPAAEHNAEKAWSQFEGDVRLAAIEPFFMLKNARWQLGEDHADLKLLRRFGELARPIVEENLLARNSIKTLFPTFDFRRDGLDEFMVESLAEIGDAGSVSVLRGLVEDVHLGARVVAALQKLQTPRS